MTEPPLNVQSLGPQQHREAAHTLARAFCDVPTSHAIYGGLPAAIRLGRLRRAFRARVSVCARYGDVGVILRDGHIVAASLTYPPSGSPMPRLGRIHETLATLSLGLPCARRSWLLDHFQHRHHPVEPHWYLSFTGVDPRCWGMGFGMHLLERTSQLADRDGVFCYLETDRVELARLYERRLGYHVTREGPVPHMNGALHNWMMARSPHR